MPGAPAFAGGKQIFDIEKQCLAELRRQFLGHHEGIGEVVENQFFVTLDRIIQALAIAQIGLVVLARRPFAALGIQKFQGRRLVGCEFADHQRQVADQVGNVEPVHHLVHQVVAGHFDFRQRAVERIRDLDQQRRGIQRVQQFIEARIKLGIGRGAILVGQAAGQHGLDRPPRRQRLLFVGLHLRRVDRIEDDATQSLRVIAHHRQAQPGAVGDAQQIDFGNIESHQQVGDIGGAGGTVVGAEINARVEQAVATGQGGAIGIFVAGQLFFDAIEAGRRKAGAALVEENDFAFIAQRAIDPIGQAEERRTTGATFEVEYRIGRRVGGACWKAGQRQCYLRTFGLRAILRHIQPAAFHPDLDLVEIGQFFRAIGGLVARQ